MNELQIFKNDEFGQVRTTIINDEPYFVGKDVAEILGYQRPTKAIMDHVDQDDKTGAQIGTSGQIRNMIVINESGVYSLIFSSELPTAKKFKRWVTSEVLPVIRKHGAYAVDELLDDPDLAIKAFTALKEERAKRKALEIYSYGGTDGLLEIAQVKYPDRIMDPVGRLCERDAYERITR